MKKKKEKCIVILVILLLLLVVSACNQNPVPSNIVFTETPSSDALIKSQVPILNPLISAPTQFPTLTQASLTVTPTPISATTTPTLLPTSTETLSRDVAIQRTKTVSVECRVIPTPAVTPINDPGDEVILTGRFVLCGIPVFKSFTFDLDTGELGTYDYLPLHEWESENYKSETDIALYLVGAKLSDEWSYGLWEVNGAQVGESENSAPSFEECKRFATRYKNEKLISGNIGTVGCVITNQGRVAMIQVESIERYGWGSIEIFFKTWRKLEK